MISDKLDTFEETQGGNIVVPECTNTCGDGSTDE